MAAVHAGSFFDAVRFSGPVRLAGPVRFARFAGSRGSVHAFRPVVTKSSRRIKTEIVTKVVAVRAGNFSIGPFCTEFRCEQLCDDGAFQKSLKIWPVRAGSVRRFAPVPAGSVHAVRPVVAKIVPKGKNRNCHENSPRASCGPLDRTILHRILVRTFS